MKRFLLFCLVFCLLFSGNVCIVQAGDGMPAFDLPINSSVPVSLNAAGAKYKFSLSSEPMSVVSIHFQAQSGTAYAWLYWRSGSVESPLCRLPVNQVFSEGLDKGNYSIVIESEESFEGSLSLFIKTPSAAIGNLSTNFSGVNNYIRCDMTVDQYCEASFIIADAHAKPVFEVPPQIYYSNTTYTFTWPLPNDLNEAAGNYTLSAYTRDALGVYPSNTLFVSVPASYQLTALDVPSSVSPEADGLMVSYMLNQACHMRITAQGPDGSSHILFDGQAEKGENTLTWDCRDQSGKLLPAGQYQLLFFGGDGQIQYTRAFLLVESPISTKNGADGTASFSADSFDARLGHKDDDWALQFFFASSHACDAYVTITPQSESGAKKPPFYEKGFSLAKKGVQEIVCPLKNIPSGVYEYVLAVGPAKEKSHYTYKGTMTIPFVSTPPPADELPDIPANGGNGGGGYGSYSGNSLPSDSFSPATDSPYGLATSTSQPKSLFGSITEFEGESLSGEPLPGELPDEPVASENTTRSRQSLLLLISCVLCILLLAYQYIRQKKGAQ
ncbi:MAG: hypothetical protein ACOYJC_01255 [Christensenellales bacterium]|jgi:hypothetical protein